MLFDLRGAGRRRTVKVVYITLAFLMGGGLVLFGIGGDVSGGLVDAITERGGGGDDGSDRFRKQEAAALKRTEANPQDAPAWAALARARFQLAGIGENFDPAKGTFTKAGTAKLTARGGGVGSLPGARTEETRRPRRQPDGPGLRRAQPARQGRRRRRRSSPRPARPPSTFTQLAVFAYQAGQTRKGDLAKDKALELTEPDMREALKGQLEQAKHNPRPPRPPRSQAPPPSFVLHCAPRPCSSTGRAADS